MPAPVTGELIGIQYLRGLAAMMVVLFHVPVQLRYMGLQAAWFSGLLSGVDIFFVISGFIMWITTCHRPNMTPAEFWWRRLTRIAPLYWVITIFVAIIMLLIPTAPQSSRFDLHHVIASLLFIAASHPVSHNIEPVVIPGWTLNYEMFFYLIFGLSLWASPRWRFVGTVGTLLILTIIGMVADFPARSVASFYTSSVMLEFAMGMAAGIFVSRAGNPGDIALSVGWVLAAAGLSAAILAPHMNDVSGLATRGIPSMALVMGVLIIEAHRRIPHIPLLHELGNASYAIYLSHAITLSASGQLWRRLGLHTLPHTAWLYGLIAMIASAAIGWIIHRLVERPLIDRFRSPAPRPAVTAAD